MRYLLLIIAIIPSLFLEAQEDYKILLNDTTINVGLDKKYEMVIDGKKINFQLQMNDLLEYDDSLFRFYYPKDFKISKLKIDSGIEQITILTAEGSGFLIQKYTTINPSGLNDMMLREITKENINYGYQLNREDYKRPLKSGQIIEINKADLSYKDKKTTYEIASFGRKDEGLIIITVLVDKNYSGQAKKVIELLWSSLIIK
jgi:hypothetical protein